MRADLPVWYPQFGQLFRCPNYRTNAERKEKLRKLGNLEAYKDKLFDSFHTENVPNLGPKSSVAARGAALRTRLCHAAHRLDFVRGDVWHGKTHLAAAIGNALLDHEEHVIFVTVPDLLDYLRSAYAPHAELGYDETFDRLRDWRVLILFPRSRRGKSSEWAGAKSCSNC